MTQFCNVFCFVFILNVAFQILPSRADNAVPVLLWGESVNSDLTNAVNPFLKTTSEEFGLYLRKKLENSPPVLLYIKDNLCIEDLVKYKQHLQEVISGDSLRYFPAVEKAVNTVEDLPLYNQTYNDYVDSVSDGQLLIVPISNLDVIPDTYKTIKDSSPNLIAMLTGKACSYRRSERVKRDIDADNTTTSFVISGARVLLYANRPLSLQPEKDKAIINLPLKPTITEESDPKTSAYNLTMTFTGSGAIIKNELVFIFKVRTAGYYTLKTINYSHYINANSTGNPQILTTDTDIVFPFNFSYHCSQIITFKNGDTALNITGLQVQLDPQPDKKTNGTKIFAFNDAYDCVGFTTIPIWTGIFVTAILALIMIWALTMIIDIRTMDRFDDPKGKTITISAQE
ncbi:V-type proton ATPase subunit S1-like [Bombus vosnesenskii]|uniref:V-type proton ATPase subunit S1-like n=1 Tax=Bombus vosnesenskii TaxID=207650 RepID=A0A6J3L8V9_9HYME|nr:V-type proton ATPase subunit S1-like [Bombus vosnesenskii]